MDSSGFFGLMNKIGDIVFLNIVFILTCLPVITIGPALAALYAVALKASDGKEGYVVRGYLKAFKENLKQGLLVGIVLEFIVAILIVDLNFLFYSQESYRTMGVVVTVIALIVIAALIPYIFALMARYTNTIKNTILNAVLIALSKLPYTILSLILMVIPVVLVCLTDYALIYIIFAAFSICAYLQSKLFNKIFTQIEEK